MTSDPATPRDAETRIRVLEEGLEAVEDELKGVREVLSEPALPAGGGGDGGPLFAPFYPSMPEWVEGHFARVYQRETKSPSVRWCSEWWQHAEAIDRLTFLWEVWELSRDKRGSSAWWVAVDHHLPILLSPEGPFAGCSITSHFSNGDLPVTPVPPGWWDDPS